MSPRYRSDVRAKAAASAASSAGRSERGASLWVGWIGAAVALAGCAAAAPDFPTAAALPTSAPAPDGVALDHPSASPPPSAVASSADGLVTLAAPLDTAVALTLIRDFFRVVTSADSSGFEGLISPTATATMPQNRGYSLPLAQAWWTVRMQRLDYSLLSDHEIYREGQVSVRQSDAIVGRAAVVRAALDAEAAAVATVPEIVATVPILTPRVGPMTLLGDVIVFHFRRAGGKFMIAEIEEDFTIP